MLEYYYRQYLDQVLHLSSRSVSHYISAIRVLGNLLHESSWNYDLFNINSFEEVDVVLSLLEINPEFTRKDTVGNRMYSVALHHFRDFLELNALISGDKDISCMDIALPKPKSIIEKGRRSWVRSQLLKEQAIISAGHQCEVDSSHATFISKTTKCPYMEAHHLIPMEFQDQFNSSLDVYANLICVCPTCHRLLHLGTTTEKQAILEAQYHHRKYRLINSDINLALEKFLLLTL